MGYKFIVPATLLPNSWPQPGPLRKKLEVRVLTEMGAFVDPYTPPRYHEAKTVCIDDEEKCREGRGRTVQVAPGQPMYAPNSSLQYRGRSRVRRHRLQVGDRLELTSLELQVEKGITDGQPYEVAKGKILTKGGQAVTDPEDYVFWLIHDGVRQVESYGEGRPTDEEPDPESSSRDNEVVTVEVRPGQTLDLAVRADPATKVADRTAKVLEPPGQDRYGRITRIWSLSDSIGLLYRDLLERDSEIDIGFIRNLVTFEKFPPRIIDGHYQWDVIHDQAVALLPSFETVLACKEAVRREISPIEEGVRNWGFRILLSGSWSTWPKFSSHPVLTKLVKFLGTTKLGFTIALGELGEFEAEGGSPSRVYKGVFLGLGAAGGLSTPGDTVFSDWHRFETPQPLQPEDFDALFARLTVLSLAVGIGYSIAYFSFHHEAIGEEAVSMYVGGSVDSFGAEAGIYAGIWFLFL